MIDKLLQTLIDSTMAGGLIWNLHKSIFNSETSHRYEVNLSDGTNIYTEISLDRDLNYESASFIRITNPDLVDNSLYVCNHENNKVNILSELVYRKFIKPGLKPRAKSQKTVLESIISSIDTKEVVRDRKISEIIDDDKTKTRKSSTNYLIF